MPMPAAPMCGYRNCSRCTAWRPVSFFPPGRTRRLDGTVLDPPQASAWCESCRRAAARARARRRYYAKKAEAEQIRRANLMRARTRVEQGDAFWAGPFRDWVLARVCRYGWVTLADWAGVDASNLRRAVHEDALTVSVDIVDRLLLHEGSTHLDDLYPLEHPHVGELAA